MFSYENGKMGHVETIPGMEERRKMEGMNSTMIYCKNFCKCQSIPPVQQEYDHKKYKKLPTNAFKIFPTYPVVYF
jgi:hypothetical protein